MPNYCKNLQYVKTIDGIGVYKDASVIASNLSSREQCNSKYIR